MLLINVTEKIERSDRTFEELERRLSIKEYVEEIREKLEM